MATLFGKRKRADASATQERAELRRQLTVFFYDIVGSTSLVEGDDPEALREALQSIHRVAREIISGKGGSLEQVMGDGGMAYFGYPTPSEDAAFEAAEAALDLLEARAGIANAPNIRIGIATGVVVLPDRPTALQEGRLGAVGVAPNLAARLEAAAEHNTVLVGGVTHGLIRRAFEFEPVDGLELKGFPDITRAWKVTARREATSRFAMARTSDTLLVGRDLELGALEAAWAAATGGKGAAILIEGEAGIGKSRLLHEFDRRAEGGRCVLLQCQPNTQGEALFALVQMYERAYEADEDQALVDAAMATAELVEGLEEDEGLSAEARRERMVTGAAEIFEALASEKPLLILAEDLHWADEVTLAILERLGRGARAMPLVLAATTRPDLSSDTFREAVEPMSLGSLSAEGTRALVAGLDAGELTDRTLDWIVEKSDGNPLFAVELAAFVRETSDPEKAIADPGSAHIDTLRDLLETRLENIGPAKGTAQVGSVLGREYTYHLLSHLLANTPRADHAERDLERLVEHGVAELVDEGETYAFRHALIRDVAYDSQLRSVRRDLHGRVVDLVDTNPALADEVPRVILAEHCLQAERMARGLRMMVDVAEDAVQRSALKAPRALLERVLRLAADLDDDGERRAISIRAITLLGPLVTLLDGNRFSAHLYETGQELYFEMDEVDRAPWFSVLWGWWYTAGDLIEQTRRSEILIRDVAPSGDPETRLQALHCAWATLYDGGAHDTCLGAVKDGLALYDPEVAVRSRHLYGHDAKVCGLGERALSTWLTGDLETSRTSIAEAEAWAEETEHLNSRLHALDIAIVAAFFRQDGAEITRILTRTGELAGGDALPVVEAKLAIFQGWQRAREGGGAEEAAAVQAGLARLRELGALEDTPIYADIAADVAGLTGTPGDALGPLDDEIAEAKAVRLTVWLPELHRRRARLLTEAGRSGAEASLDEGLELAISQNANMLVLKNLGSRLSLGLGVSGTLRSEVGDRVLGVSESELRTQVLHALKL